MSNASIASQFLAGENRIPYSFGRCNIGTSIRLVGRENAMEHHTRRRRRRRRHWSTFVSSFLL